MKLTVFGATGGIGRELVRQALDAGHEVTAVVRDPGRLNVAGGRLEVVRSGLADAEELRGAVRGRSAVPSGLGAQQPQGRRGGDPADPVRSSARWRRRACAGCWWSARVRSARLRRTTAPWTGGAGPGVGGPGRTSTPTCARWRPSWPCSGTDWTSVRPPRLQDKPLTGRYRTVVGGFPPRALHRARGRGARDAVDDRRRGNPEAGRGGGLLNRDAAPGPVPRLRSRCG